MMIGAGVGRCIRTMSYSTPLLIFMNKKKDKKIADSKVLTLLSQRLTEERRINSEFVLLWNTEFITHFYGKEGLEGSYKGYL